MAHFLLSYYISIFLISSFHRAIRTGLKQKSYEEKVAFICCFEVKKNWYLLPEEKILIKNTAQVETRQSKNTEVPLIIRWGMCLICRTKLLTLGHTTPFWKGLSNTEDCKKKKKNSNITFMEFLKSLLSSSRHDTQRPRQRATRGIMRAASSSVLWVLIRQKS